MTPEEKAKELIDKFERYLGGNNGIIAAELCCDEVIAEIEDLQQNCVLEFPMALAYWQQVKEAIQKL